MLLDTLLLLLLGGLLLFDPLAQVGQLVVVVVALYLSVRPSWQEIRVRLEVPVVYWNQLAHYLLFSVGPGSLQQQ